MKRLLRAAMTLALLVWALALSTTAAAAPASTAYLIGARAPLTQAQTQALKDAGAQVTNVYKNFGGAAAVIPDSKLSAVRALSFVTSVNQDTVRQLDAATPPAGTKALPNQPYWHDLIDTENNTAYDGSGVWVAVLDSGFYPNWRDYINPESVLEEYGSAFVGVLGNANENQWDAGSDPHGMAVSATIVGHRFVDDS